MFEEVTEVFQFLKFFHQIFFTNVDMKNVQHTNIRTDQTFAQKLIKL